MPLGSSNTAMSKEVARADSLKLIAREFASAAVFPLRKNNVASFVLDFPRISQYTLPRSVTQSLIRLPPSVIVCHYLHHEVCMRYWSVFVLSDR